MGSVTAALPSPPTRRRQVDRSEQTRAQLVGAAVIVVHRLGYVGASTALIAEEAGMSRGAIIHQFGTRASLMAEVVRQAYEWESAHYDAQDSKAGIGGDVADWPGLLWETLSRPSGVAVLEILQATRSDPELASLVRPMQAKVEQAALAAMQTRFGSDIPSTLALMRLLVWAVRGLTVARVLAPTPDEIDASVVMLRDLLASSPLTATVGADHRSATGHATAKMKMS